MAKRPGGDLMVGTIGALALVILAVAAMTVGEQSSLLTRTTDYKVRFPNAEGLIVGSPVKLDGVQIGSVTGIRVPTDPEAWGVDVAIGVRQAYASRLRQDTSAALRYLQLLSGEKFVDITAGNAELAVLDPGAEIPVEQKTAIFEQGAHIAENLSDITVALSKILEPLEKGEGLLGEMIQNPEFGKEGLARLIGTLENMQAITGELRAGRGFLGRVISDQEFAGNVDDLSRTLEALAGFVEKLERGDGALGPLLEDDGAAEQAIESLRAAAASLAVIAGRLEKPDGFVGRLINDPVYSNALADDLGDTLHHLAEITRKIDEGEGTLGALVNERTLHDGMEDIAAGTNDSKFARWLMRHYQKKGIKLSTEQMEKLSQQ